MVDGPSDAGVQRDLGQTAAGTLGANMVARRIELGRVTRVGLADIDFTQRGRRHQVVPKADQLGKTKDVPH